MARQPDPATRGGRLELARVAAKMSRRRMAEALGLRDASSIYKMERNNATISAAQLQIWARETDVPAGALLDDDAHAHPTMMTNPRRAPRVFVTHYDAEAGYSCSYAVPNKGNP